MLNLLNQVLWAIATAMIVLSGIYFTCQLKGIQFRWGSLFKSLLQKNEKMEGISPVQTLMMSLAGRIGVGSIAGVALAIYMGGIGSVFWMWMIALISAANTYVETFLGIRYKEKTDDGLYVGGPSYYIKKGLKNTKLGILYAVLIFVSYIIGFIGIQSNTIVKSFQHICAFSPIMIGCVITILSAIIIFGGVQKIANATSKIVPIMTGMYVCTAIYIVIRNIEHIPYVFSQIISQAFCFESFFSAFIPTLIIGIQRGLFSNEAGLGTGSIAASSTSSSDGVQQGYLQMLGIYITTFFICTSTAIIILTSNYQNISYTDMNGIELTQHAFQYHLGQYGNWIVFLSIILFSFSTILTGYYYGETSMKYICGKITEKGLLLLRILTLAFILLGSIISSSTLWILVDIFVAVLAIINTYSILKLKKEVEKTT